MLLKKIHASVFVFFISLQIVIGQLNTNEKSVALATINQHTFTSTILDQDVALNVYLPENYFSDCDLHQYPLILLLEDEFLYQVTGVVKHLSSVNSMPESIVVSFPNGFNKFYAPKLYTNNSHFWSKNWKQMPFDGSPEQFTSFLREELFKYLKKQYRVADYRIVLGTSLTATYSLHAFCKAPDLFQGHIAIAAGDILGMGYTPNKTFTNAIKEHLETSNAHNKSGLYIAVADEDITTDPTIENNLNDIKKQLSLFRDKNPRLKAKLFSNESHYGVVLPAFISAMETFFPKKKWNPDFKNFENQKGNTLDNIDAYYKKLSIEYGYPVLPKAERWNSGNSLQATANRLLRQKRFKESIEVYRRLVVYRPKSPEALSILASALEANNNLKEALAIQQKALHIAKKYNSSHVKYYQENVADIESKVTTLKVD